MIVVIHLHPVEPEADFTARAEGAIAALAARPGFVRADLGRAVDDPEEWVLFTEWRTVGDYRRALGGFEVKMTATPLLAQAADQASAFEVLLSQHGDQPLARNLSDRAAEPAAAPGPAPADD